MTGERVLAADLAPGDIIHVEHTHNMPTRCLCGHWETDAVVIAPPERVCGHVVVHWQETSRLLGGMPSISGANAYGLDDEAIRIGHLASAA